MIAPIALAALLATSELLNPDAPREFKEIAKGQAAPKTGCYLGADDCLKIIVRMDAALTMVGLQTEELERQKAESKKLVLVAALGGLGAGLFLGIALTLARSR